MFKHKKVLIVGGTGSLGQALTNRLLKLDVESVRIYSRNESKQIAMQSSLHDDRLRYLIGDVRDLQRLERASEDIDIIFHTAALKHVPNVEYNPFEAIKTNVIGSQNVIDAAIQNDIDVAVAIGTDKAVSPLNTYGATKLLMEKLFVTANNYLNPNKHKTKFIALRYGNVLGSSGSVIPKFIEQIKNGKKITITDPKMTRFSITMDEALDFILNATEIGHGSEIFLPKLNAYNILDLKDTLFQLFGDKGFEEVGIRPGEKLHETLINADEIKYTWELDDKYLIFNPLLDDNEIKNRYAKISKVKNLTSYTSDTVEKIPMEDLKQKISKTLE